jgi:hypothetical protein
MDQKDLSGLTFINYLAPGLVTLSAVLITALSARPPLDSARPFTPRAEGVRRVESSPGFDAQKGRPWEDPFTSYEHVPDDAATLATQNRADQRLHALQEHFSLRVARPYRGPANETDASENNEYLGDKTLCLFALVPSGSDSDAHETRLRIRYALTSALTEQGFSLSYPKRLTYFDINVPIYTRSPPQRVVEQPTDFEEMDRVQWNELDQRWSPRDITWFDRFLTALHGPRVTPPTLPAPPADRLTTLRIPIKLYARSDSQLRLRPSRDFASEHAVRQVLVFWIDEDRLGRAPLDALTRVYRSIFHNVLQCDERRRDLHLAILGPTSSDILHLMDQELTHPSKPKGELTEKSEPTKATEPSESSDKGNSPHSKSGISGTEKQNLTTSDPATTPDDAYRFGAERACLFSYRATAFSRQSDNLQPCSSYSPLSFCQFVEQACKQKGLRVRTVIGNDLDLAIELRDELKLRGAWPTKLYRNRRILLLTERDTNYGRNQQNVFRELIRRDAPAGNSSGNVEVKTYLRGLDGIVPSREYFGQESLPRSQREADVDPDSDPSNRAPYSGSSQRDYIDRLAQELQRENTLWKRNGAEITAIGLLGSDVYDKLLLLRGLRRYFPKAYFFTTDLDSELSHPTEKPFSQGLLVASHFGLKAGNTIQKSVPPFRDALQTSAYIAVYSAIKDSEEQLTKRHSDLYLGNPRHDRNHSDDQNKKHEGVHPLLFQIGHSGPHPLPHVRRTEIPEPESTTGLAREPMTTDDQQRLKGPPLAVDDVHVTDNRGLSPTIWWWLYLSGFVVSLLILLDRVRTSPPKSTFTMRLLDRGLGGRKPFRLLSEFLYQPNTPDRRYQFLHQPFAPMVVLALLLSLTLIMREPVQGSVPQYPWNFAIPLLILLLITFLMPSVKHSIRSIIVSLFPEPDRYTPPASKTPLNARHGYRRFFSTWYAGPLVLLFGLAILATFDHYQLSWQGDPVLFFEGISSWPITLIRALAVTLSCLFCYLVFRRTKVKLQRVNRKIESQAFSQTWRSIFLHDDLFRDFRSIYMNVVISLAVAGFLFCLTDYPPVFSRGPVSWGIGRAMLAFSVVFLLTLNFLIVHLIREYYTRLRSLVKNETLEGGASPSEVGPGVFVHVPPAQVSEGLFPAVPLWPQSRLASVPHHCRECVTQGFGAIAVVQLIARQTDAIGKCLLYPAIVAIVLISARFPWLDRSGVPLTLLPLALFLLSFPFGYYFALRWTAQKLRNGYVSWLELHAEERGSVGDAASERVLRHQINQLYSARWGVYRNWKNDWVLWALLIPLGGSSGLLILERSASLFGGG